MTRADDEQLFLFAGGGTGGHIYPALAIAEELKARLGARARFHFICSSRAIDRSILSAEGVAFTPAPAQPLSLRPLGLLRFLRGWAPSIRLARGIIREAGAPGANERGGAPASVHVVAMGGFVAAPVVQAARVERCPVLLVNLDAVPGKANRWIARRAAAAVTACPVDAPYARAWKSVGPIVRSAARAAVPQAQARSELGLDPDRPVLMITGGSQGAGSINDFMAAFVRSDADVLRGWQVLHQAGHDHHPALTDHYAQAGVRAIVTPFVRTMGLWWSAADVAISRAGAGSVAEAWAAGVPTLFLPYPHHRDQHQRRNADVLVRAEAAVVHVDHLDPSANLADAGEGLRRLLRDPARRAAMRAAAANLGPPDGARLTSQILTSL
ncbi:MAG: glycosyltransferase [Phycisphaerales bacterium]